MTAPELPRLARLSDDDLGRYIDAAALRALHLPELALRRIAASEHKALLAERRRRAAQRRGVS